jgi:hypothetical protein
MMSATVLPRPGPKHLVHLTCLLALTLSALSACAPLDKGDAATPSPTRQAQSLGLPIGSVDSSPPPVGWQRWLNGVRFADAISTGLAASGARPGRLAGCALPAGSDTSAIPVFVLSEDSGRTWQARRITGAETSSSCSVLADPQQADVFAVGTSKSGNGRTFVTVDAGKTWRPLDTPCGPDVLPFALVNGNIFAGICPGGHNAVARVTAGGIGPWEAIQVLPAAIVGKVGSVEDTAIDPDDPNYIYTAVTMGSFDVRLYASRDSGRSWRLAREWPTAEHVGLWTAHHHQVFVKDSDDREATSYQFFYSADGGDTWRGIGLHDRTGEERIFVGADGRVVTFVDTSATEGDSSKGNLFALDPTTGVFSLIRAIDFNGGGPSASWWKARRLSSSMPMSLIRSPYP